MELSDLISFDKSGGCWSFVSQCTQSPLDRPKGLPLDHRKNATCQCALPVCHRTHLSQTCKNSNKMYTANPPSGINRPAKPSLSGVLRTKYSGPCTSSHISIALCTFLAFFPETLRHGPNRVRSPCKRHTCKQNSSRAAG